MLKILEVMLVDVATLRRVVPSFFFGIEVKLNYVIGKILCYKFKSITMVLLILMIFYKWLLNFWY